MFPTRRLFARYLRDIIADVSSGIRNRRPVAELVETVTNNPDFESAPPQDLAEYVFACARLRKLSHRSSQFPDMSTKAAEAVEYTDATKLAPPEFSQLLWACAVMEIRPLLPDNFSEGLMKEGILTNKDLVTIISAVSKFIQEGDNQMREEVLKLTALITPAKSGEFSNEDLVALARSIAIINSI